MMLGTKQIFAGVLIAGIVVIGATAGGHGEPSLGEALGPPSMAHLLGTDVLGRDLAKRLFMAMTLSLAISASAWAVALILGAAIGAVAGYAEDSATAKLVEGLIGVVYATPFFLVLVALLALLGPGIANAYLVLLLFAWAAPARHAHRLVRHLRVAAHIRAALAFGYRPVQMARFVLLPQILPPVVAAALMTLPEILALDVVLSFFGLGTQPPTPSVGGLLVDGLAYSSVAWWLVIFPMLLLVIVCLAIRSLGVSKD